MDTNILGNEIKDGISLVTSIKNRNALFVQAFPTWVTQDKVNEIIVIDWDSRENVKQIINTAPEKVKYVKVVNQPYFNLTKSYNLGIRCTSFNKVMKIDCDIKIVGDFFSQYKLKKGIYFQGNHLLEKDLNDKHINGTCFFNRENFLKIKGYDERLKLYGMDDTDLYERFKSRAGLEERSLSSKYLKHINHARVFLSDSKLSPDWQWAENVKFLEKARKWGNDKDSLTEFKVNKLSESEYVCEEIK